MYISKSGNILRSNLDKLLDTLSTNLELDINDVPFSNLGIVKNFSKNTYSDTIDFITLQISDMIKSNGYSDQVSVSNVSYDQESNLFTIDLEVSGDQFNITFGGD